MKQKIVVILILLLTLISCKKEFNFFQQENEEWSFNGNLEIKDEEQYNTITIKKEEKAKYGFLS